jgi:hypothetical protein
VLSEFECAVAFSVLLSAVVVTVVVFVVLDVVLDAFVVFLDAEVSSAVVFSVDTDVVTVTVSPDAVVI